MNKKVLIIGGGVVVLGAIGYLYFTNKKKQEEILSGGATATQPSATTQTGATSSATSVANDSGIKPLSVLDVVYTKQDVNLDKAKELVKLIVNAPKASFLKDAFKTKYIQQLKDLGYVYNENNGVLTKL
jgi:uncharacterized membrane protein YebE (DUF533 family)